MSPLPAPHAGQRPLRTRWPLLGGVLLLALLCLPGPARAAPPRAAPPQEPGGSARLSPFWGPEIQRWAGQIGAVAQAYGFHPDFVAAVISHEGDDQYRASGRPGGLLGLPAAGGAGWRAASETMLGPAGDLRWGMAVLSYVVQQAGGDLYTALAAYHGGWQQVNGRLSREYAARVLDSYARALLVRAGLAPEAATRWTIAVDIRAGNVPEASFLVLGQQPLAGPRALAPQTVYAFAGQKGHAFYITSYVVPVGLSELVAADSGRDDALEAPLRARLGDKDAGSALGNPRVLLACLARMERLRGQVTTRWYSPSGCPPPER